MIILSIDTSCDETSVAVTEDRRILSNKVYSQILIHKKWGGVVPYLAKRAHEERIDMVVEEALKKVMGPASPSPQSSVTPTHSKDASLRVRSDRLLERSRRPPVGVSPRASHPFNDVMRTQQAIDYIAVTYGPGLAPALEVGIEKAKELARQFGKKIIPVDHMEGHIYSCFAQNSAGNPQTEFEFPYLALLVSGGHTELVKFTDHIKYQIIGKTLDDAIGEALDKAAKMLGLGYPGGPVIERLAQEGDPAYHQFTIPMKGSGDLNFSYSGLKTAFLYYLKKENRKMTAKHLKNIAASFQHAAFAHLLDKLDRAISETGINSVLLAGGVGANRELRKQVRSLVKKHGGTVLFPTFKTLCGDNAAMIGVAAHYKAEKGIFVKDIETFDRVPRTQLSSI